MSPPFKAYLFQPAGLIWFNVTENPEGPGALYWMNGDPFEWVSEDEDGLPRGVLCFPRSHARELATELRTVLLEV